MVKQNTRGDRDGGIVREDYSIPNLSVQCVNYFYLSKQTRQQIDIA